jgi:Flp pilus assembly protein TadD
MRIRVLNVIILMIFFITVIDSGCLTNTSKTPVVSTQTTSVPVATSLHEMGFDAYIKGDYENALWYFNQSLAANPKYTRAWVDKGNVLLRLNRTEESIQAYDNALELENNLANVWNSRGEALMKIGNFTGALESFNKSLEIAPEYSAAKNNRDLVLEMLNN